jgi:large subunit ribosomal protein L23
MSARREKPVVVSKIQAYDMILSPVVTEKSTLGSEYNQVTFKVKMDATKPQIKLAVEEIFNVKVKSVNTLRQQGKVKRFRGRIGRRPDCKKAIVSLVEGETIDVTSGI